MQGLQQPVELPGALGRREQLQRNPAAQVEQPIELPGPQNWRTHLLELAGQLTVAWSSEAALWFSHPVHLAGETTVLLMAAVTR